jgi:hypothetical protein
VPFNAQEGMIDVLLLVAILIRNVNIDLLKINLK